jgi:hypothetical protein
MPRKQKPGVAGARRRSVGQPPHSAAAGTFATWALGRTGAAHTMSERERKLTAAIYAQLPGVLAHVKKEGRLPPKMRPAGGAELRLRVLVEQRGIDIELSKNERAVFEAIGLVGEVTAGRVVLFGP